MWSGVSWFVSRMLGTKATSERPRRMARRSRLAVERLEGREVPATITVTTTADVLNPADGKVSLREALLQANSTPAHDTIVLPAGVFRIALTPNPANPIATGSFDLLTSATLVGAGPGRTVIDAGQVDRVFAVSGTSPRSIAVVFQGLTIRGGKTTGDGGGLLMGNADVTLRDCAVAANRADGHGGGIANALAPGTGNLTLVRTSVSDNSALGVGGGVSLRGNDQGQGSALSLFGSTVLRNTARADGGGIRAETVSLATSTVSGNTSPMLGGGIRASTVILTNSTVSGNKASDGGGVYAESAAILTNSTVSGNTATQSGGGISAPRSTVELTNSTVSGNVAGNEGGGLYAFRIRLMNATIVRNEAVNGGGVFHVGPDRAIVRNTIIALNRALDRRPFGPDVVGAFVSEGHNLIGDATGSTGFGVTGDQVGTAQRPIDPKLSPLQNNGGATLTHVLLAGSPAIDRGNSAGAPAVDQRGVARSRDGDGNRTVVADIGAVER